MKLSMQRIYAHSVFAAIVVPSQLLGPTSGCAVHLVYRTCHIKFCHQGQGLRVSSAPVLSRLGISELLHEQSCA